VANAEAMEREGRASRADHASAVDVFNERVEQLAMKG
jgi:hypothetical protein